MEALTATDLKAILNRIAGIMTAKKEELIRLDGAVGDGDLGLTMEKAFAAAREEAARLEETDLGKFALKIGSAIARAAPSTMGTLVATGFMSGGKAVSGRQALGLAEIAAFFEGFTSGIMQRGKSKPGEKTLLDVLQPASEALKQAAGEGVSLDEGFRRCRRAAAAGLEASRDMVAQHGRVAYYGEQSRGKDDPGAVAASYILSGFCEHLLGPAGA
jgi:phosphoenolpyruvate---glycerone phosphotransferase subunit DhaL